MIVHKLKVGDGPPTFHGSEAEAREAYKAKREAAPTVPAFPICCTTVYVDPGKQGVIDALNEQCK